MLKCKSYVKGTEDSAYWVPVNYFLEYFDQNDFNEYRDAKTVSNAYSEKWFYTDGNKEKVFELPTVCVIDENTQFISGRHRVAVLIKHLSVLPIAFAPSALDFVQRLNLKLIDRGATIELPELPIVKY
jgi:hypothetical protein